MSSEPADPTAHKSFWEHFEDLRKAIIRSGIAIGLTLIVCLTFADRIVQVLEYPLQRINLFEKPRPTVSFRIGAKQFGPYQVSRDQFAGLPDGLGPAPHVVYQVGLATAGQDQVATLKLLPPTEAAAGDNSLEVRLHNFGPAEGFFIAFHVSFYAAVILSAPIWMYFIGRFIMPALHIHERRAVFPWLGWSLLLFLTGVLATYFVLLPVALRASVQYSYLLGFDGYDWRADDYISFVTHFILGMGLGFQFPIILLFLVKIGMLTHKQLAHYRRHFCVLSFILGAMLTTPEVITQIAMAVPLYLLYEICIWIAWYWERKKRRQSNVVDV